MNEWCRRGVYLHCAAASASRRQGGASNHDKQSTLCHLWLRCRGTNPPPPLPLPPPPRALPCGPVSPWNNDVVIVDVAPQAPSHVTLYCWLCCGTQPEQALNIAFQWHPVAAALDVATQAYPCDFVLLTRLWQSASLEYCLSVASCCCCLLMWLLQLVLLLCCGIQPGSGNYFGHIKLRQNELFFHSTDVLFAAES